MPKSPKSRGHLHCLTHDEWMEEVQRQVTICSEYKLFDILACYLEIVSLSSAHASVGVACW